MNKNQEKLDKIDIRLLMITQASKGKTARDIITKGIYTPKTIQALKDKRAEVEEEGIVPEVKVKKHRVRKSSGKRTKYTYPEGMSQDDKRKFRIKARKEANAK